MPEVIKSSHFFRIPYLVAKRGNKGQDMGILAEKEKNVTEAEPDAGKKDGKRVDSAGLLCYT